MMRRDKFVLVIIYFGQTWEITLSHAIFWDLANYVSAQIMPCGQHSATTTPNLAHFQNWHNHSQQVQIMDRWILVQATEYNSGAAWCFGVSPQGQWKIKRMDYKWAHPYSVKIIQLISAMQPYFSGLIF